MPWSIHKVLMILKNLLDYKDLTIDHDGSRLVYKFVDIDGTLNIIAPKLLLKEFINIFSVLLIVLCSLLGIGLLYMFVKNNLEEKRKEIGVFLSNGISKGYFISIYALQALFYFAITTLCSIPLLSMIKNLSIWSVEYVTDIESMYEQVGALGDIIALPFSTWVWVYVVAAIFLLLFFTGISYRFTSKRIIELMR